MRLPRILALLLLTGALASAAEPLYIQYRPLSGLPWQAPEAGWEQVIRRIYREPVQEIRGAVLEEYLKQVPAADFPQVYELCLRLEEEDSPDVLLGRLMYVWAEKDPAAAWEKCLALYEIIIPQDPLSVDSWGTGIVVLNPEAVAASYFWPESDHFAEEFARGLADSMLPEPEKARFTKLQEERSAAWEKAYQAADKLTPHRGSFGPGNIQSSPPSPPTPAEIAQREKYRAERAEYDRRKAARHAFLLGILATPPLEIQARLTQAGPEIWDNEPLLARALIRWMDGKAERAPEIAKFVLDTVDPQEFLRTVSKREPLPLEFVVEWGLLDSANHENWTMQQPAPEALKGRSVTFKNWAVVQALAFRDNKEISGWVSDDWPADGDLVSANPMEFHWVNFDPGNALPWIWSHGGVRTYVEAASKAVYGWRTKGSNVYRSIFRVLDESPIPIPDDPLYMIMEQWSDTDAAGTARHGVRWNLRVKLYPKSRMIRLWTGYVEPGDGAVDDRHFGSLRIWAMRRPEEMRAWIRSEPLDEDVREALLWLVDHAKGGYQPRTNDGPPIPVSATTP
jgi:hypothetical protein